VAVRGYPCRPPNGSPHWLAGWNAGYAMRGDRTRRLNKYLLSIGLKPMGVVVT
jgi:hypothetical protein